MYGHQKESALALSCNNLNPNFIAHNSSAKFLQHFSQSVTHTDFWKIDFTEFYKLSFRSKTKYNPQ